MMLFSFAQRTVFLIAALLVGAFSYAQMPDSVQYKKEWLYVYPYEQDIIYTEEAEFRKPYDKYREIFIPLSALPDGKYVQLIHLARERDAVYLKKRKSANIKPYEKPAYAMFHIASGKLNGEAYFFNGQGDTLEKGSYIDNFKEGTWYYGPSLTNYVNYQQGLQHGITFETNSAKNKKKSLTGDIVRVNSWTNESVYEKGILMRSVYERTYTDGNVRRTETEYVAGKKTEAYTKVFLNDILIERGRESRFAYTDSAFFYYEKTGALKSALYFDSKQITKDYLLYFWVKHCRFDDSSHHTLTLEGIAFNSPKTFDYTPVDFSVSTSDDLDFFVMASGTYYYPNGRQLMRVGVDSVNIQLDTLFHDNGQPKYVVFADSVSGNYVARYFDETGKMYREIQKPITDYTQPKTDGIVYQDYFLEKSERDENLYFYYEKIPTDSLRASTGKRIYYNIYSTGEKILREVYYEPSERTLVELINPTGDKSQTISKTYDADFMGATVRCTTSLANRFDAVSSFQVKYNLVYPFSHKMPTLLDLDERIKWVSLMPASVKHVLIRDLTNAPQNKNYFDPLVTISNVETTYLMDQKRINSRVEISLGQKETELKQSAKKLLIHVKGDNEKRMIAYPELDYDRFGLSCGFGEIELVPDFLAHIPGFYGVENMYSMSYDVFRRFSKSAYTLTGEFKQGKLHGAWTLEDEAGNLQLEARFDNGKPIDSVQFYVEAKLRKGNYLVQQIRYDKNSLPEQIYFFSEGGDTSLAFWYKNGKPVQLTQLRYSMFTDKLVKQKQTAFFEEGKLINIVYERKINKEPAVVQNFVCENEIIAGPIDLLSHKGNMQQGKFYGTSTEIVAQTKKNLHVIENGMLVKIISVSEEDQVMWELELDQTKACLDEEALQLNSYFPYSRFPYDTACVKSFNENWEGQYTSWHGSGTKRAEGLCLKDGSVEIRKGVWNYYHPDGSTKTVVEYVLKDSMLIHGTWFNHRGKLDFYRHDTLLYKALVIEKYHVYNCFADENDELRTVCVLSDFDATGKEIPYPTRYHYNYYDAGSLQSEGPLVKGLPDGLWKFYNSDGGLKSIGQYSAGKRHGTWYSGDLSGVNFLGAYCINPNLEGLNEKLAELEKELQVTVTIYDKGKYIHSTSINVHKK